MPACMQSPCSSRRLLVDMMIWLQSPASRSTFLQFVTKGRSRASCTAQILQIQVLTSMTRDSQVMAWLKTFHNSWHVGRSFTSHGMCKEVSQVMTWVKTFWGVSHTRHVIPVDAQHT
jgi:hypothetical protein